MTRGDSAIMSTLQLGDSGAEVSDLQDRLYQLGYELYGGGDYDLFTEEAVRRFQTDCGLEPTGVADDDTIDYLSQYGQVPLEEVAAVSEPQALVAGGTANVVDANGNVVAQGTVKVGNSAGALGELSGPAHAALELALATNSYTAPIPLAIELANSFGWTVAMGVDSDLAAGLGGTWRAGLYFAPGDEWGLDSTLGADFGWIDGASVNACFAAVKGGSDKFASELYAIQASGGEGYGGGFSVLYNTDREFVGVAGEVGLCAGITVNAYGSWTYTGRVTSQRAASSYQP
jgi:peptidoglycan hydrolase-like protein with peptidoglycan-binding domain